MKYYLDTNIIIYALNGRYPAVMQHFQQIPAMAVVIPAVVLAEIEYGARKSHDYGKTMALYQQFLSYFTVEPFTARATADYGRIRAELEKRGQVIGANDLLIAATVKSANGILVTHNTREFARIDGLQIEDWTQ